MQLPVHPLYLLYVFVCVAYVMECTCCAKVTTLLPLSIIVALGLAALLRVWLDARQWVPKNTAVENLLSSMLLIIFLVTS